MSTKWLGIVLLVVIIAASVVIDSVGSSVSTTFVITLNKSVSDCLSDSSNHYTVTLNDLTKCRKFKRYKSEQRNEFIFESGTHILNETLSVGFAENLTVQGQVNSTIKCATESVYLQFTSAPNSTLMGLHFQDCKDISVQHDGNITVEIFNCSFSNSSMKLIAKKRSLTEISNCMFFNSYLGLIANDKNLITMTGIFIVRSLLQQKTNDFVLSGHSSSDSDITCTDAAVHIYQGLNAVTKIHDLYILNCNSTQLFSWAKNTTVVIAESKFINSCLQFKSRLTRSDTHTQ